MQTSALMKEPSAYVPLAMSLAMLLMLLGAVAWTSTIGPIGPPDGDEGALAHIFQLTMVLQAPIAMFFAIRWIPQAPKQALQVLALQASAWLAAVVPVFILER
jgi:hypothetical protein